MSRHGRGVYTDLRYLERRLKSARDPEQRFRLRWRFNNVRDAWAERHIQGQVRVVAGQVQWCARLRSVQHAESRPDVASLVETIAGVSVRKRHRTRAERAVSSDG